MKSIFCSLILCLLLFTACKTDPKESSDNNATTTQPAAPATDASDPHATHTHASESAPQVGMWHYETIIGPPEKIGNYTGRWVDIRRDNTFSSGIYLEENNSGTWTYNDANKYIKLHPKESEEIETEWMVNSNGDYHIWMGNTTTNKSGLQIRMKRMEDGSRPGK